MPQRPLSSLRGPRDLQAELHARYAEEMLPKVIQARARTRDSTRIHMQCVMSIPNPAPLRPCRAAVAQDCTAASGPVRRLPSATVCRGFYIPRINY